jgi:hypothetical protein
MTLDEYCQPKRSARASRSSLIRDVACGDMLISAGEMVPK